MTRNPSPEANCDAEPGRLIPVVDSHRCENKGPCVEVCPYEVFEIHPLSECERKNLPWRVRFKVWAHGGKQSFVTQPEACHACGLCVPACPERAITLTRS